MISEYLYLLHPHDILVIMSENIIIKNFGELRFAGSGTIRGIHMLLNACDDDFTPRLSTRHDCHHADFNDDTGNMTEFMYSLMREHAMIAFVNGNVAAFAAYDDMDDCLYLALILTGHEYRGLKLASRLYDAIESNAFNNTVKLRISSRNETQKAILDKRGYEQYDVHENHRGDGLHTLFYVKHVE